MKLSIIGKPMFYRTGAKGGVYPCRISSRSRGSEIAEYLEAQFCDDFRKCKYEKRIFLKPRSFKRIRDGDYIDVLDNHQYVEPLKRRPGIKLISMCQYQHDYLSKLLDNDIRLIYHPHINFKNKTRAKNKELVGGMIGKGKNYVYRDFNKIKAKLEKIGVGLDDGGLEYRTKQDMLDFYNRIDFLVIWYRNIWMFRESRYVHPGKIINSASFGIPVISQYIKGYQEFEGNYLQAETRDEIVEQVMKLKNENYYRKLSTKLLRMARPYHISKIAEEYKKL